MKAQENDTATLSLERSIELYNRMLKHNPDNPVANYGLAYTSYLSGNYEKSTIYARKCIGMSDSVAIKAAPIYVYSLDACGRTGEAIKQSEKLLKRFPAEYKISEALGFFYFKQREYTSCINTISQNISNNTASPDAYILLSMCLYEKENNPLCAMPLYYYLLFEENPIYAQRALLLIDLLLKQKHALIKIPYFEKRLALRKPTDILMFMFPEKTLNDDAKNFLTNDFMSESLSFFSDKVKGNALTNNSLQSNLNFFTSLYNSGNLNAYLYTILRSNPDNEVKNWLSTHKTEMDKFAVWLETNLPDRANP
jgi:hypothetical protein